MKRNLLVTTKTRNKYWTCIMVLMLVSVMVFTSIGVEFASAQRVSAPATLLQTLFSAQNPELDSTFNFDGKVTTEFGSNNEEARAIAVQPDGKIILAGYASPNTYSDFVLVRYNSDGSLDDGSPNDSTPNDSFGNQGKVITDFNGFEDVLNDLAIQPDGKIVAVGYATRANGPHAFAMARYNTDGSLDNAFGTAGKVTTAEFGPNRNEAEAVAIQMDGKIVLAGHYFAILAPPQDHVALARYDANGTLDNSFDGDGMVKTSLGGGSCSGNNSSRAYDLAIQPDGRLVIVGNAEIHGGTPDTCSEVALTIARYTQFGQLDASFNGNGVAYMSFTSENFPRNSGEAVALQPDGRILAAGSVEVKPNGGLRAFALARYNSDGSLDGTFGKEGRMITTVSDGENSVTAHSMAVESGGRILLAGSIGIGDSRTEDFFLARYNPNGSLDETFGADGTFSIDFGNTDGRGPNNDRATAIAVQPDGRILIAGSSGENPSIHFVAGRLSTHVTDLAISMSVSTNDVVTGTNFTYSITATNLGPNRAEKVEITDVLPPELTFVSSSPVTEGQDNHRTLRLGSLDSGSSVTLTIEATVSCLAEPGKVIANTAQVTSPIQDPDTSNNAATAEGIASVPLPIKCSPDIVSTTPVVHYPPPRISDDWPDVISVHCSPSSGASFPVGTTTVRCVATDKAGNTASCRFNVTVAMLSTK